MIGTLGKNIIFTVSSFCVLTFKDLKHEVKGRWTMHDVLGGVPRAEFLGPDVQSASLTIHLSIFQNIWPEAVMSKLRYAALNGEAEYFIVGGQLVIDNPVRITSVSEAWNTIYHGGILAEADVTVELEEYV